MGKHRVACKTLQIDRSLVDTCSRGKTRPELTSGSGLLLIDALDASAVSLNEMSLSSLTVSDAVRIEILKDCAAKLDPGALQGSSNSATNVDFVSVRRKE